MMSLFRDIGAATVITAHQIKSTTNALGLLLFSSSGISSTAARFTFGRDSTNGTRYSLGARRLDANVAVGVAGTIGGLNTSAAIATAIWRTSAAQVSLRIDGSAQITNAAFQSAGNTSNTDSLEFSVCGVVGASVFLESVLCELMAWPRELTLAEIQTVERYLSRRYGVSVA
jgi:hypothetical protein